MGTQRDRDIYKQLINELFVPSESNESDICADTEITTAKDANAQPPTNPDEKQNENCTKNIDKMSDIIPTPQTSLDADTEKTIVDNISDIIHVSSHEQYVNTNGTGSDQSHFSVSIRQT